MFRGIFLDDARFTNVMIERNIIVTSMIRGISVSGARNTVARYNTVLDVPGAGKATYVMLDGEVYGNIMSTYPGDKKLGIYEGNLLLQHADPRGRWHYDTVFPQRAGRVRDHAGRPRPPSPAGWQRATARWPARAEPGTADPAGSRPARRRPPAPPPADPAVRIGWPFRFPRV
jgi:hypothetical protein